MKKKTTIWVAAIFILLTIFFLKIGFSKSNDNDPKKIRRKDRKK